MPLCKRSSSASSTSIISSVILAVSICLVVGQQQPDYIRAYAINNTAVGPTIASAMTITITEILITKAVVSQVEELHIAFSVDNAARLSTLNRLLATGSPTMQASTIYRYQMVYVATPSPPVSPTPSPPWSTLRPASPNSNSVSVDGTSGLTNGAISGIAIGAAAGCFIVIFGFSKWYMWHWQRKVRAKYAMQRQQGVSQDNGGVGGVGGMEVRDDGVNEHRDRGSNKDDDNHDHRDQFDEGHDDDDDERLKREFDGSGPGFGPSKRPPPPGGVGRRSSGDGFLVVVDNDQALPPPRLSEDFVPTTANKEQHQLPSTATHRAVHGGRNDDTTSNQRKVIPRSTRPGFVFEGGSVGGGNVKQPRAQQHAVVPPRMSEASVAFDTAAGSNARLALPAGGASSDLLPTATAPPPSPPPTSTTFAAAPQPRVANAEEHPIGDDELIELME